LHGREENSRIILREIIIVIPNNAKGMEGTEMGYEGGSIQLK